MSSPFVRRALVAATGALVCAVAAASAVPTRTADAAVLPPAPPAVAPADIGDDIRALFGRSGKLRFHLVSERRSFVMPVLERLFGREQPTAPGVYAVQDTLLKGSFAFVRLLPFSAKSGARLGSYRVGYWPAELRRARSNAYENPAGFIRVTAENQNTQVSEHFRLRDFLTKDQHQTWPKYLVLREELIDKLELVIQELERDGVRVDRMRVMSGFRTPQYNVRGVGKGGRASDSRHQYGDAADVFVDNDGNENMDDLNRDGRIDHRDAQVILRAVERVEARYPDLVGGAGVYRSTRAHGPFAHVDVRGNRARWGLL